jgi:hypothetical protein
LFAGPAARGELTSRGCSSCGTWSRDNVTGVLEGVSLNDAGTAERTATESAAESGASRSVLRPLALYGRRRLLVRGGSAPRTGRRTPLGVFVTPVLREVVYSDGATAHQHDDEHDEQDERDGSDTEVHG